MRYIKTINDFGMIVSNDEYELIQKIKSHSRYPLSKLSSYYQELGDKLYSKGSVLDKVVDGDEEYFVYLRRKKK